MEIIFNKAFGKGSTPMDWLIGLATFRLKSIWKRDVINFSHCYVIFRTKGKSSVSDSSKYLHVCTVNPHGGVKLDFYRKNGVDCIAIPVSVTTETELKILKRCFKHSGEKYDYMGAVKAVIGYTNKGDSWYCSEFVANVLNWVSHKEFSKVYTPTGLYEELINNPISRL